MPVLGDVLRKPLQPTPIADKQQHLHKLSKGKMKAGGENAPRSTAAKYPTDLSSGMSPRKSDRRFRK